MNKWIRRAIAVLGGAVIFWLANVFAFQGRRYLSNYTISYAVPSEAENEPIIHMQQSIDDYAALSMVHLALAAAISFVILFWEKRPGRRSAQAVYALLLSFTLPLSALNFASGDYYIPRSQQFLIDLILVVLGTICVQAWRQIRFKAIAERIVHSLVLFILVAQAIALPAIYAMIWWLEWQGLGVPITLDSGWVSALAAVVALAVSIIDNKRPR